MLWISTVLLAGTGLRTASRMMGILVFFINLPSSIPSWYTGRIWLMRLGYYKLNRRKEKAEDWVWIIDHSMQLSSEKCLVILGIRLCYLPTERALSYADVEPIELIPVTKSNGDIVYEQLENAKEKTGIPREIIGDHGSDIKAGIEKFCNRHEETCYIHDIKHAMSIAIKQELKDDADWEKLISLTAKTKREICQTALAPLVPANQRKKSRYMNADILVTWVEKMRMFLNQEDKIIEKNFESKKVREKFSWINELSPKIEEWKNLIRVTKFVEVYVAENGLNLSICEELEKRLNEFDLGTRGIEFKELAIEIVKKEAVKAKEGERLLGSSEIIESLFGKQKSIEKEQSRSGFTGLLLVLPALIAETSREIVKKALESIPTRLVVEWYQKHINKSVQTKRKEAFKKNNKEQKWNQKLVKA
jgi:hypothetical protein